MVTIRSDLRGLNRSDESKAPSAEVVDNLGETPDELRYTTVERVRIENMSIAPGNLMMKSTIQVEAYSSVIQRRYQDTTFSLTKS